MGCIPEPDKVFPFMKELDQVIKKRGFVYTQLFADTSGYVYRQDLNGVTVGFEVFRRKENTQFNCVSFPGDNAFGIWAFATSTFERANEILKGFS